MTAETGRPWESAAVYWTGKGWGELERDDRELHRGLQQPHDIILGRCRGTDTGSAGLLEVAIEPRGQLKMPCRNERLTVELVTQQTTMQTLRTVPLNRKQKS